MQTGRIDQVADPLTTGDPAAIGGRTLVGRLGAGGMGVVYLAEGPVAIKTMRRADAADPGWRARFRAEASCAGRVGSAHTAKVIEDGSESDLPYLVTEFLDGPSLDKVIADSGPLRSDALYAVAIGVADALAAIHEAGIVHRDVKPSNVLLTRDGPRVIDFGIARDIDSDGMTQTGLVVGSPGWVAPERLTGSLATPATDVFGWGMLVAYAASGEHPYGPGSPSELTQHVLTRLPDLSALGQPLRSLAASALSLNPSERPAAEQLRHALLAPRSEPTAALAVDHLWTTVRDVTPGATRPLAAADFRHGRSRPAAPFLWGAAALLLAAGAATAGVLLASNGDGTPQQPQVIVTTVTGKATTQPARQSPRSSAPQQPVPSTGGTTPTPKATPSPTASAPPTDPSTEKPPSTAPSTGTGAGDQESPEPEDKKVSTAPDDVKENEE